MKKIYYVPGIISLIALLPICIKFLHDEERARKQYALEIVWFNKKSIQRELESDNFTGRVIKNVLNKHFHRIDLNQDDHLNFQKLSLLKKEIQRLTSTKDTLNGIQIRFKEGMNYRTLIQALDISYSDDRVRFLPLGDDIFITYKQTIPLKESERLKYR